MVKPTERRVGYGIAIGYGVTDLFMAAPLPLSEHGFYFSILPIAVYPY